MRWCVFLLALMIKLHGIDVPQEDKLSTEILENGVKIWLQENTIPSHMVSLKVVWKTDSETNMESLDCPYDLDEISSFLEFSKDNKPPFAKGIGIIAVGDFDKNRLRTLIKDQFSEINFWTDTKVQPAIAINVLEDGRVDSLKFSYPTPIQNLKTDEDLKKQWAVYFLQKLIQQEFQESLKESGGVWSEPVESNYLIPQIACIGKVHSNGQSPLELLNRLLGTIQEVKMGGFSDEKFQAYKADAQKILLSLSRRSPDSNALVSYYADQFAYGQKCPPYSFFIQTSLNLISEMTLRDVHLLVDQYLKDNNRLVEINLVQTGQISEDQVKETLDELGADNLILAIEDEQNDKEERILNHALAYIQLPLKPEESKVIGEIVEAIGNHGWLWLGVHQTELREKEKQIKHVHPLRFLGEIFSNANLKACMRKVEKDRLTWSGFLKGLKPNMEKEMQRNNLYKHVEGFCQAVRADPDKVKVFIQKHDWSGLVKYLIQI